MMEGSAIASLASSLRESVLAKSAAAYASISWMVLQIVETFISGLGLPDWVFTGFLLILAAGVPVVLLAARAAKHRSVLGASSPTLHIGRLTFRRAALAGGLMIGTWSIGVAIFMASWAFGIGPAASLLASGTLKQSDHVLIADFKNETRDETLAATISEAVRLDLSQSNLIRVVDRDDVGEALERMNKKPEVELAPTVARDLAVREGMAAVLEGEVAALGPATLVVVRLVDPRSGTTLAEFNERAASESELLDAVDRLTSTLRNKIGEPLTRLRDEPALEKVTTSSLPALRAYTQANEAHALGKKEKASGYLQLALSHDSSFPMAWRKLGVVLGDDDPAGASTAYTNAFRLRENLPERERELATASYYKNVEYDLPQAMAAYRRVLSSWPEDEVALNNLANLLTTHQRYAEALGLQQRLVRASPRFAAYSNLFNSQIRLRRLDEARATHLAAARLFPDQRRIKFQPIILAVAEGKLDEADRQMELFLRENTSKAELLNDLFVARYFMKRGRLDRARAIFRNRARLAGEKKPSEALKATTSLVAIARLTGDLEGGRAILAEALAQYPLDRMPEAARPHLDLAEAYALVGQVDAAKHHYQLSLRQGHQDSTLNYDQRQRTLGLLALAERDYARASRILSAASSFGQCATCVLYDLGLALESEGRTAEAVDVYRRFVEQAPFALARAEQYGFVLVRLSQLQRSTGDSQAAARTDRLLRELWSGSDASLLAQLGTARAG